MDLSVRSGEFEWRHVAPAVEGARVTTRSSAAEIFANVDQHRVVLIVQRNIGGNTFHEKLLKIVVTIFVSHHAMTGEDPLGIGVNNENGFFASVQ